MKFLILLFTLLLFIACKNKKNESLESSVQIVKVYINPLENRIDSLIKKSLIYGDTNAYYELSGLYIFQINKPKELFFYAFQMATKYHYSKAYFDLYFILSIKKKNIKLLDSCSYNMAMFYLLKAYEKGSWNAENAVRIKFEGNKIPNSKMFRDKFCY